MEQKEEVKKQRTEKQKAATAKALLALKARRELGQKVIDDSMKAEIEEAEERIVAKVMSRMGAIKPSEEEAPMTKSVIRKAAKPKKVVMVEESSSEEEVVVVKKKVTAPTKPEVIPVPEEIKPKSTGNKLLDRLYGFA